MRWPRWFLIVGRHPEDALYAAAIRSAAKRFGGKIVGEKQWAFEPGNPHADSGHVSLQAEIPPFTRGPDHDVLIVADERGEFGEYLPYRTALPRPVAGTQGLVATAWSPVLEQWGALQLQSRFARQAQRRMGLRDYTAWLAVRAVGEAATRTRSDDPQTIRRFMAGPEFRLGGFKGAALQLPALGWPAAPADAGRRAARARVRIAPAGVPARRVAARFTWPRRRRIQVQAPMRAAGLAAWVLARPGSLTGGGHGRDRLREQRAGRHGLGGRRRQPRGRRDHSGRSPAERHRGQRRWQEDLRRPG